ncbi:activating signal cointegrator 1 complex subunit 2-like protein [Abeliophyllum distichum]|uniref:Activating signal cointegrator 1 complex subunit 2-like protein n=1 Tax=Abeliophyllum distichum TaxID=126358 RepID=A0ABD1QE69_9LAMI
MAPLLAVHSRRSERSEARTEGRKDRKHVLVKLGDVKEKLEFHEDDDDENLLFSNLLKAMELSINFRMSPIEKYNERRDSTDHINVYKTKLQGSSPAVKCKNFHTTLTSDVKRGYNKLKPKALGAGLSSNRSSSTLLFAIGQ